MNTTPKIINLNKFVAKDRLDQRRHNGRQHTAGSKPAAGERTVHAAAAAASGRRAWAARLNAMTETPDGCPWARQAGLGTQQMAGDDDEGGTYRGLGARLVLALPGRLPVRHSINGLSAAGKPPAARKGLGIFTVTE